MQQYSGMGRSRKRRIFVEFTKAEMIRLLALLVWFYMTTAQAVAAEYQIGPAPGWVVPLAVDLSRTPDNGQSSGEWHILSDVQARIERVGRVSYYHYASKALDADGVHEVADLSFVYDPSFEQLTIHAIRVLRDGQVIDKLAKAKISVLQRETELEYRIYDGSKTVSVVLDDLRAGDVVEYAYSRRGINPVLGNRVAGGADLQWAVPVGQASVRLLVPAGRTVALQLLNSTLQRQERVLDGYREYRWAQENVPAIKVERDAPASYNPYAGVRWSEFADWKAVVEWGIPLYGQGVDGPELEAAIEKIRSKVAAPAARVRAVLQQVQSDIRYLGVEVGTGSYIPTAPDTVFQRRFGDCKDKALLVIAMLRKLGVHAVPALVNTSRREAIGTALPAPNVFNHVVVRVTLDGRYYWLDPTASPQGGDLENMVHSDHGLALVLAKGETGLSKMAGRDGRNRKQIRAVFDGRDGDEKPMRYTITTISFGAEADDIRNQFARRGVAEMQSQYIKYYAKRYAEIKVAAPLRNVDDLTRNQFTTIESYEIPEFWKRANPKKRREGYIRSSEIRSQLSEPENVNRVAPLTTRYPEDIEEITEVKLSGEWTVRPEDFSVEDPAFEFSHKMERGQGDVKYLLTDRLRWRKSQIEAGEAREYAANLKKSYNEVGMTLYLHDSPSVAAARSELPARPAMGWKLAAQAVVLLSFWAILAFICWRSPMGHRSHNWYLMGQLVWISAALWILATAFPSSWKTQTLALIVLGVGGVMLTRRIDRAPETHWQHAHVNPEALAAKGAGTRYLVYCLDLLPTLCALVGVGYYLKGLMS
jgi:transglutaminase-like putative cysteine protease